MPSYGTVDLNLATRKVDAYASEAPLAAPQAALAGPLTDRRFSRGRHQLTLRYLGEFKVYESQLQLSRWTNGYIVELCICGVALPSFVLFSESDWGHPQQGFLAMECVVVLIAVLSKFCKFADPLFGKQLFEWALGAALVLTIFLHAAAPAPFWRGLPEAIPSACAGSDRQQSCDASPSAIFLLPSGPFMYGPMCLALMNMAAVIMSHVLHLHPTNKLLVLATGTLCSCMHGVLDIEFETEIRLVVIASLAGLMFGYALESQLRQNFAAQLKAYEALSAQRRADSRLNHVIKGICGGASGLLLGLQVQLEECEADLPQAVDKLTLLEEVRRRAAPAGPPLAPAARYWAVGLCSGQ